MLELRERYEEFFLAGGRIPKGPPPDDDDNDIFQVTGDPFDNSAFATTTEVRQGGRLRVLSGGEGGVGAQRENNFLIIFFKLFLINY